MSAIRHQRAAEAHGSVECSRCHAREQLDPEAAPAVIEQQVRAFTSAHSHGNVSVVTPLSSVRGPTRARCRRCGEHGHNLRSCSLPPGSLRRTECSWCGALATTRDEDGDPSCAQHAREVVRPEVLR